MFHQLDKFLLLSNIESKFDYVEMIWMLMIIDQAVLQ